MSSARPVHCYAICLGITAITLQIVLTREFFSVFYGNELCIGILLSVWLFWVAVGSRLGVHLSRYPVFCQPHIFPLLQFCSILSAVIAAVIIKYVRIILAVPQAEFISFAELLGFAWFVFALPCMLVGLQFSQLAVSGVANKPDEHRQGSVVYIYEALGSAIGGIAVSLAAVRFFSNFQVLFLWGAVGAVIFFICKIKWCIVPAVLFLFLLFLPPVPRAEFSLLQHYWHSFNKDMHLVERRQSRFSELSVIEWGGEKTLYSNSVKQTLLPDPLGAQELAALVMTQHPQPGQVLLIGGGLGGAAAELARNRYSHIVYVELDREAYTLMLAQYDSVQRAGFMQDNLKTVFGDGRAYLDAGAPGFDVIIVNVGKPATASGNRYYTAEFLQLARSKLAAGGILAICGFPAAENYFGPELLQLNAGLYALLREKYADVLVLPGDNAFYFAAVDSTTLTRNPDVMSKRFGQQGLVYDYFYPQMFWQYYQPERLAQLDKMLANTPVRRLNSDFSPVSWYYDFVLWNKLVRGHAAFFSSLASINYNYVVIISLLLFGLLAVVLMPVKKKKQQSGGSIILLTVFFGLASITVNIILLLAFQVIFGYIYEWLGILMGVFMAGMALAAYLLYKSSTRTAPVPLLIMLLTTLIVFLLLLIPALTAIQANRAIAIFMLLVFTAGAITGGGFPLLLVTYTRLTGRISAGVLYAADLAGGAGGSCLMSGFFIPLYGFSRTLFIIAGIGILLCLMLLITAKTWHSREG